MRLPVVAITESREHDHSEIKPDGEEKPVNTRSASAAARFTAAGAAEEATLLA